MSLFNSKSTKNILIIDFASGSVGVGIVILKKNSLPNIITINRSEFSLQEIYTSESFEIAAFNNLKIALEASIDEAVSILNGNKHKISIDDVLVSFSSPWLITRLHKFHLNKEQNFILDQKIINEIIAEGEKDFYKELENKFIEKSEIFGTKITALFLNGYEAVLTVSRPTKFADIEYITHATKANLIRKIENEILKKFGIKHGVVLESFMYAFMKVFSNSFKSVQTGLLVNMSNEVTDFMFLKQGVPVDFKSISFGSSTIIRSIKEKLGVSMEVTESYLSIYAEGLLGVEISNTIEEELSKIESTLKQIWESSTSNNIILKDFLFDIYLIGPLKFEEITQTVLKGIFKDHEVIIIGKENKFTKEIVELPKEYLSDEKFSILASYSNIIF